MDEDPSTVCSGSTVELIGIPSTTFTSRDVVDVALLNNELAELLRELYLEASA